MTVIVNEREFFWDSKSQFYDEKGYPTKMEALKKNGWVYIVGVRQNKKPIVAGFL
jgi:hypothetical protein